MGLRYFKGILVPVLFLCLTFALSDKASAGESFGLKLVGQVGGATEAVAVRGNYAYVGVGLRLVVLDVSKPEQPVEVGATAPFPYFVQSLVLSGNYAYIAAGGAGLRIVDISDPAHPVEVGSWDSPGYAEGVAVVGTTAYLADGPYGLRILNVTNPKHPVEVSYAYPLNYAFGVAVSGGYAYIAAAGAGLLVADVSNRAQPVEVATVSTPGLCLCGDGERQEGLCGRCLGRVAGDQHRQPGQTRQGGTLQNSGLGARCQGGRKQGLSLPPEETAFGWWMCPTRPNPKKLELLPYRVLPGGWRSTATRFTSRWSATVYGWWTCKPQLSQKNSVLTVPLPRPGALLWQEIWPTWPPATPGCGWSIYPTRFIPGRSGLTLLRAMPVALRSAAVCLCGLHDGSDGIGNVSVFDISDPCTSLK